MLKQMQSMPLWRDASLLQVRIEEAVRHFPRYHKYALGTDLRRLIMDIVTVHRGGRQSTRYRQTVTVQQCRRFGQADRRRVPRVRKPGRSSEDVVLLNGYWISAALSCRRTMTRKGDGIWSGN